MPRKTKLSLAFSRLVSISPVTLKAIASEIFTAIRSSSSSRLRTEMELGVSRRSASVREPETVCVER